jgi:flagella basal body P-ring formation protein FlgA
MKNKHRRLLGRNNPKARRFYRLATNWTQRAQTKLTYWCSGLAVALMLSAPGQASNIETIQTYVDTKVHTSLSNFARSDINIDVQFPANSLLTSDCASALEFEWRGFPKPGQNTVKTACADPRWQLYLSVNIQVFKEVVISSAPLSRNKPLERSQLTLRRMDIAPLRLGYFDDIDGLQGYLLQRTLQAGQVITPYIVKAPALVARGDWVTIRSGSGGLVVTTTGKALKDGALGDQIPLKNLNTQTTVRAWVIAKGVVSTRKADIQTGQGQ